MPFDTWHITPDTWHVTPDMWHMMGGDHSHKISAPRLFRFGINGFQISEFHGDSMTESAELGWFSEKVGFVMLYWN